MGGARIAEAEKRVRTATRSKERDIVNPTMLFHFQAGQLVTRRQRVFSKMDPKSAGPYIVRNVAGLYRQRVTIEATDDPNRRRALIVHASALVPFETPYLEPDVIDLAEDAQAELEEPPGPELPDTGRVTRGKRKARVANVWTMAKAMP